jgi:choline-sulfatase
MAPRPNLLLLMTDQQRADALGCASGWVRTPNLDRLAAEGVRFRNCVTNSPVCIPARLSLATGLYPHNTGVWDNLGHTLDPETPTWMQAVRGAGYRTSLFGKTHLHPHTGDLREREPLMHTYGLDDVDEIGGPRASARVLSHMTARWQELGLWDAYRDDIGDRFATKPHVARPSPLPLEEYGDVYVGRRAQQYLAAYDRPEPWCCWVSFGGPHEPWDTPEPHASLYMPDDMPAPAPLPAWTRDEGRPRGHLHRRLASAPDLEPGDIPAMRASYAGNVTLIDEQIGGILDTIEARGELDNTVIIFTSDHGELNGDFGLIYKSVLLDGAVRVPLIVRTADTARAGGVTTDSPAEWIDVGATLADAAGVDLEYTQFARSLLPTVSDPERVHRREAFSEHQGEVMLLDERWKGAVNREGQLYLLFDRVADPLEQDNLAGSGRADAVETDVRRRILEHLVRTQVYRK